METIHGEACIEKAPDIIICPGPTADVRSNPPPAAFASLIRKYRKPAIKRVYEACLELYGPDDANDVKRALLALPVKYNGRLRRANGRFQAMIERRPGRRQVARVSPIHIEISKMALGEPDDMERLLVHEYSHAARCVLSEDYMAEDGHGPDWKELMVAAGAPPTAYLPMPGMDELPTRADFKVGDAVSFRARGAGEVGGFIHKMNPVNAKVQVGNRLWRVPYAGLRLRSGGRAEAPPQERAPAPAPPRTRAPARRPQRSADGQTAWLFSYGSNSPDQLEKRLGHRPSQTSPARLMNHERVFRGHSRRWGGGVASLRKARGEDVYGYIAKLKEDDLDVLDRYEGVRSGNYERVKVNVRNADNETVTATAYVSTSKEFNDPSISYLTAVAETFNEFWDEDYNWTDIPVS